MNVFLSGEGPSELGDWAHDIGYRSSSPSPGVIEGLLRRVRPVGWEVTGSRLWRNVRKYRSGDHASAEERNVRGVALEAWESGCRILAFTRDRDGYEQRSTDVEKGIAKAVEQFGPALTIVGGVAVEEIESWILSLQGERRAESIRRPKERVRDQIKQSDGDVSTGSLVAIVDAADLGKIPTDAESLRAWLDRARKALGLAPGSAANNS